MHAHAHNRHGVPGSVLSWSLAATFLFVVVEAVAGLQGPLPGAALRRRPQLHRCRRDAAGVVRRSTCNPSRPMKSRLTATIAPACSPPFVNALTLLVLSAWIFYEGLRGLQHPEAGAGKHHDRGGGARAADEWRRSCWRCAAPAGTTSTCAAPSSTCWATRWARSRSSRAPWRSGSPAGCRSIRCSRS